MAYLYYWKDKVNAGDYFTEWLAKKLYKTVEYSEVPNLIITGSLLGFTNLSNDTIVWGAGWHNAAGDTRCYITNKNNFKAVRGKLTAEKLNLKDCALGDPGLLLSNFYVPKQSQNKKKYCIVCHWKDFDAVNKKYGKELDVISMATKDIEGLADKLSCYELVMSTSLHGIIFAHSLNIPAVHVEVTTLESKDNFKFKDYFSVLDIPYKKYIINLKADYDTFNQLYINRYTFLPSRACIETIQKNLLAVCPKEEDLDKKYNTVVCAIAKNEQLYINNWVQHNLTIGVDHIYLFNNDDNNKDWIGTHIKDIDKVTVINVNNIHKHGFQLTCYNRFYARKSKYFNWAAFIDIDEFITGCTNINTMLANPKLNNFNMVRIKWRLFGDDNVITRDTSIPVQQFFKKPITNIGLSNQGKCIIRGGLDNISICSCHYAVHGTFIEEKTVEVNDNLPLLAECLPSGKKCTDYINMTASDYSEETVYLNHYMTKTLSEFIAQKLGRGDAVFEKRNIDFEYFWNINKKTEEKQNYINKVLKINKPIEQNKKQDKKKEQAYGKSGYFLAF